MSELESFNKDLYRLRLFYNILVELLKIHYSGYVLLNLDETNTYYLRLCNKIESILEKPQFKELSTLDWRPFENLLCIEPDAPDVDWEYGGQQLCANFKSAIESIFIQNGEKIYPLDSDDQQLLDMTIEYLQRYSKIKKNADLYFEKLIDKKSSNIDEIEPYYLLRKLETELRYFIECSLSNLSKNWWKEKIPDDVRNNAEERKNRNENLWPWYNINQNLPPIAYIDFSDYIKIISRRDNWQEVFKDVFKNKEWITTKLNELEPIRNAIAHNRPLTEESIQRLKLNVNDILKAIDYYLNTHK